MRAERVEIVGMQPQPPAGVHERARHPGGLEPKQPAARTDGVQNLRSIEHAIPYGRK